MTEIETLDVGDIVAPISDIVSGDDFGTWLCAASGDRLVVRRHIRGSLYEVYRERHQTPCDCELFWIRTNEVDLIRGINEDRSNLAYVLHATPRHYGSMDKAWDKVASILREFKKKKHTGFYFEVEELSKNRGYIIKVFRDVAKN